MVFSSTIFLFFFLPLTLAVYYLGGRHLRNIILLSASLLFYAWGETQYVLLMLFSIALNYLVGRLLAKNNSRQSARLVLLIGVAANLGLLGFYKYANFLVENYNALTASLHLDPISLSPVHLPIGISFFTFQAISYIIDVYRRDTPPQKNLFHLGLYIASFPQLIAGPIVRYHDVARQILERRHNLNKFAYGVERFIIGLGKKVLIANTMGEMADRIFGLPIDQLSVFDSWLGISCYTLQIYFDFSGYSDMAIGLGYMFGFRFLENFNYPYISRSITEFWRRWHISLSTWFRDYLYIPLGGSRKGRVRTYANLVTVFLLCGLWHGASWNFIAWGGYHGFFLVLERWRLSRMAHYWPGFVQHLYTLLVVMIGWVFFRAENMQDAITYLGAMFGIGTTPATNMTIILKMDSYLYFVLVAGILGSTPIYPYLKAKLVTLTGSRANQTRLVAFVGGETIRLTVLSTIFILVVLSLASGAYNPFIYFRF